MSKIAELPINSFASSEMQADFVSPSEQSITVSLSDLRQIITEAVQKAIEPLQDEVMELKVTVASQGEEIAALRSKVASLESLQEQDTTRIRLDIAYDRRRLAALEKVEPQPLQKDRGEILRALIAANGGKMLAKEARGKMHLPENRFSELLARMEEHIDIKPLHSDKRKLVIILKSELLPRK